MALTFPGARTAIGTRDVSGLSGVMHVTNRWAILIPIATVFCHVKISLKEQYLSVIDVHHWTCQPRLYWT